MTKFNKKAITKKTTNLAGGKAYKESTKLELISILLTSFLNDQFYRSGNETAERTKELIAGMKDKLFVAKLALFARNEFGMRSISHLAAGEIANSVKGQEWTKTFFEKIIHRADDMLEITSYYLNAYGKPLPNSLKKGFGAALANLKEYQLAKYKGNGNALSMIDLVNLVHPRNTPALKKLMNGKLKPADTWETKLTQAGQNAESEDEKDELKGKAWKELIKERKLGYFALLRNLRNISEQAPEVLDQALEMLVDEKLIKNSLVLPFRFTTAYDEISKLSGSRKTLTALSDALDISVANVPKFDGRTLVVLDRSGSMEGKPAQIGSLFAATLVKSNDADLMLFSDEAEYKNFNPRDSVMTIASSIKFASGGTNFHSIFSRADKKYDRVIILSDMQGWMGGNTPESEFRSYCKNFKVDPYIYSFDLNGYGTLQFPESKVLAIAGFSEKIFEVMNIMEQDKNALIKKIEDIKLW